MKINTDVSEGIRQFVRDELSDGVSFEELLEDFDILPEDAFLLLFLSGQIDEDILDKMLTL